MAKLVMSNYDLFDHYLTTFYVSQRQAKSFPDSGKRFNEWAYRCRKKR